MFSRIKTWIRSRVSWFRPRRWVIASATVAALTSGGYKVATWDTYRGYPIIDTTTAPPETLWFDDSLGLINFTRFGETTFNRGRFSDEKRKVNVVWDFVRKLVVRL